MKKIFQRSHYGQLLAGACDVEAEINWSIDFGLTGFETNFDGGRNTHNPSDFFVLYAELEVPVGGKFCEDNMVPKKIFMLKRHERFSQDHNDENYEAFYELQNPEKIIANQLSSDWWEFFDRDLIIKEEKVSSEIVFSLKKGLEMMKSLYGQGNQDGLWGKPSKKKYPVVELIPSGKREREDN